MAHRTEDHSNLKLFRNRLWKLMEEKHIFTTKELAKILYNKKLVTVKQRHSYDDFSKIYGNAIESVDKKIQKHLRSDTADGLQGEYVIAYCNFFGCSADYLFGSIDCKTHDSQFIQDETGLSQTAIGELRRLKFMNDALAEEIDLNTINILIEQMETAGKQSIIHWLTAYLRSSGLSKDIWYDTHTGNISTKRIISTKEPIILINSHSDTFDNLILATMQKRIISLKEKLCDHKTET